MTAIITTKNVLGGKPRISGTRMSVDVIGSYITKGYGTDEIKKDYPHLKDGEIKVALKYIEDKAAKERKSLEPASS